MGWDEDISMMETDLMYIFVTGIQYEVEQSITSMKGQT